MAGSGEEGHPSTSGADPRTGQNLREEYLGDHQTPGVWGDLPSSMGSSGFSLNSSLQD